MRSTHTKFNTAFCLLLCAVLPAASIYGKGKPQQQPSIVEIALSVNQETGEFSTLIAALQAADLVDTLNGRKHFTVFAPTDEAFGELGLDANSVGGLETEVLTDILLYHVTRGDRFSESIINAKQVRMLNGGFTMISQDDQGVLINESRLLAPDLIDIDARNGVIHVIDAVLLPQEQSVDQVAPNGESIVEIAVRINAESGEFSTLIAALQAANLVETLDGNRQFTVFAPTDAAFAAIGYDANTIGDIAPEPLTDILLYHLTTGHRLSQSIVDANRIRMLNRDFTFVSTTEEGVFINESRLLAPDFIDIEARNGVIHVIDAVLLPPEE